MAATETPPAAGERATPAVSCFSCGRVSGRLLRIRHEASGSEAPMVVWPHYQGSERARPTWRASYRGR
jgi:hypothetical protein